MSTGPVASAPVRCPSCAGLDDKVVDSRSTDDGTSIRRRRQCLACGARFTTYERVDEVVVAVVKRSGRRQAFDRDKITSGVRSAAKNRPLDDETIEELAASVEDDLRLVGTAEVTSQQVGLAVLERLRTLDPVTYLRFASVYREFTDPADFERELGLLAKSTEPKGG